jgi:hypothetical protein
VNCRHAANITAKGIRVHAFLAEHLGDQVTVDWLDGLTEDEWARIGDLADERDKPEESRPVVRALILARDTQPVDVFAGLS